MRQWLIYRLPQIELATINSPDVAAGEGLIHRFVVCLDMAFGQFGSHVPDITISSRTALRCMQSDIAPLWALVLGVLLEAVNPGHLQSAIYADYRRAKRVLSLVESTRP